MKWILIAIISSGNGAVERPIDTFSSVESCMATAKVQHGVLLNGNSPKEIKQNSRFVCRSVE
jgi:hypothetical protein